MNIAHCTSLMMSVNELCTEVRLYYRGLTLCSPPASDSPISRALDMGPKIQVRKTVAGTHTSSTSGNREAISSLACFLPFGSTSVPFAMRSLKADNVLAMRAATGNRTLTSGIPLASVRLRMTFGIVSGATRDTSDVPAPFALLIEHYISHRLMNNQ